MKPSLRTDVAPPGATAAAGEAAGPSRGWSLGSARAVGAVTAALVAIHVRLQGRVRGPWLTDEVAYLRGAQVFTGGSPPLLNDLPYYRWGYSLLLAPVEALPLAPSTRFGVVTVVNAVLLAAVYPLVRALLVRVTQANAWQASLGALVAALQPVVWVYGGFALSEPLLLALVPAWLLTVHASARDGRPSVWFVATTLGLYATHDRLVVCLVPAAWLLVDLARRPEGDRRRVIVTAAALGVGLIVVGLIDRWMVAVRWASVAEPQSDEGGALSLVGDPSRWGDVAGRGIGHLWQLVVSGGVPLVVAVAVAVAETRRRARRPGPGSPGEVAAATVVRSAVVLLGGLLLASVVFLALAGTRADHFVYGRYAEIALPPVVGLGMVAILLRADRVVAAAWATAGLVVVTGVGLAALPWTSPVRAERVAVLHAPSLALLTDGTGPLNIAMASGVAVGLAAMVGFGIHLRGGSDRTSRRRGTAIVALWVVSLVALDLARSAHVLDEGEREHARAVAER